MQIEENKVQSQQRSGYNFMMTNVTTTSTNEPSILQHSVITIFYSFITFFIYIYIGYLTILCNI